MQSYYSRRSGVVADSKATSSSISRSGHGGGNDANCFDLEICPDLLLAAVGAFGAVAFFLLYQAITMAGKKRRRRRQIQDEDDDDGVDALTIVQLGS